MPQGQLQEVEMKNFKFGLFVLALAAVVTPAATAGTISYYPLTFGSNFPFVDGGPCTVTSNCVIGLVATGQYEVNGSAVGIPPTESIQSVTFSFDIAPQWGINYMRLGGTLDAYGAGANGANPAPFSDWGYEFIQQLTLCSSSDVCTTTTEKLSGGGAPLPPFSFNTNVGAGTGVYQTFLYLDNAEVASDAQPGVDIDVSEVPEPSSWLLLAAGLPGLAAVLFRKASRPALIRHSGC
jgi:hypothetical protein